MELIPISANARIIPLQKATQDVPGNKVFIVHGHDEEAKQAAARYLEKFALEPIILHEQVSAGRTIIEKLEFYSDVDFAVVLLTPDDVGAVKTSAEKPQPRARQNVILELGYFVGKLGRDHVCALHRGNLDLPSDFIGVVYIPMDAHGAWRYVLGKELKAAGFDVDLNKPTQKGSNLLLTLLTKKSRALTFVGTFHLIRLRTACHFPLFTRSSDIDGKIHLLEKTINRQFREIERPLFELREDDECERLKVKKENHDTAFFRRREWSKDSR